MLIIHTMTECRLVIYSIVRIVFFFSIQCHTILYGKVGYSPRNPTRQSTDAVFTTDVVDKLVINLS